MQAVDVGEDHQRVGLHDARDHRRQRVVVAELDLLGGDGVVLIDDRQRAQIQQAVEGVADVGQPPGIVHAVPGEQHLGGGVAVLAEELVVDVHQLALAHRRAGLTAADVVGLGGQLQLAHTHADGTGGYEDDLNAPVAHVREHAHQMIHAPQVQLAAFVGQRGRAHFHHHAADICKVIHR